MNRMPGRQRRARRRQLFELYAQATPDGPRVACCFCGELMTLQTCTIEHVIPSCKGGGNGTGNLMLSCHKCNQRRGSQDFYAFRARLTQGRKTPWREFPSDVEIILVTRKRNGAAA